MENLINEFISMRNFAVAGSFKSTTKFAYKILVMLNAMGRKVFPINPAEKTVEGIACYKSIALIPAIIDVVILVTPPAVTEEILKQCLDKGIDRVWMQPGAESEEAMRFCSLYNIKAVYNVCILQEMRKER